MAGGPCPIDSACMAGSTCDAVSRTCIENDVPAGGNCGTNLRCAGFLQCVQGTCQHLAEMGQPCDPMGATRPTCDYLKGLVCPGVGLNCVQISFAPPGGTCGGTVACSLNSEGCNMAAHQCIRLPSPGQPCDRALRCNDNSYCDTTTSTRVCVAKNASDEPCVNDAQCASPLVCTQTTTTSTRGICRTPSFMLCP
jgi:hypothetical protein